MKAKAKVIRSSVKIESRTGNYMYATAHPVPNNIYLYASATDKIGMRNYLYVTPEEPQLVEWLVPDYGIEYNVYSNVDWVIN